MARELCVVCQREYVDPTTGKCPNGCTDRFFKQIDEIAQSGDLQEMDKLIKRMQPGIQKSKAHTWKQQSKKGKRKK